MSSFFQAVFLCVVKEPLLFPKRKLGAIIAMRKKMKRCVLESVCLIQMFVDPSSSSFGGKEEEEPATLVPDLPHTKVSSSFSFRLASCVVCLRSSLEEEEGKERETKRCSLRPLPH